MTDNTAERDRQRDDWWHGVLDQRLDVQGQERQSVAVLGLHAERGSRGLPPEWKWQVMVAADAVVCRAREHMIMPLVTWMDFIRETVEIEK